LESLNANDAENVRHKPDPINPYRKILLFENPTSIVAHPSSIRETTIEPQLNQAHWQCVWFDPENMLGILIGSLLR
jgi:hypothetical protein